VSNAARSDMDLLGVSEKMRINALWSATSQAVGRLSLGAAAWLGASAVMAANAVNDLPGGPAVNQLNLHPPVTRIAEEQISLHWMMMIICIVIFVAVFAVMFYSILKHRKSKGAVSAKFHEAWASRSPGPSCRSSSSSAWRCQPPKWWWR